VTTSFARSSFADVAGTPFFRSLSNFIPWVNVSLISSSRGISMGSATAGAGATSERGVSGEEVVQDCWNRDAASRGVERLRDVISSVFCSISRCNDCTRASNSASNGSISSSTHVPEKRIPCCSRDDDREGFIPFISSDELAISNVRDTNWILVHPNGGEYLIQHLFDAFAKGVGVDVVDCGGRKMRV